MRNIIEKLPRLNSTDFVFPNAERTAPFDGVPKMWKGIREAAGLHDVRLHDLRHSAASFALMSGVGLEVIGKLLGHSDLKTTRRYAHLADAVVRSAAEHTADQIASLMSPPPEPPAPAAAPGGGQGGGGAECTRHANEGWAIAGLPAGGGPLRRA